MTTAVNHRSLWGCGLLALALAWCQGPYAASAEEKEIAKIAKPGPLTGDLAGVATIVVPAKYRFIPKDNIKRFNDLTQNLTSPTECGVVLPPGDADWYILFAYTGEGYIKDSDKGKIDAAALLKAMQEREKEVNKQRTKQKIPTVELTGWEQPPRFDDKTKTLSWGLKLLSDKQTGINYNARILGRAGYMSANLVVAPEDFKKVLPEYTKIMDGFAYKDGQKYGDWKPGDKVAPVGLQVLIGGTAK